MKTPPAHSKIVTYGLPTPTRREVTELNQKPSSELTSVEASLLYAHECSRFAAQESQVRMASVNRENWLTDDQIKVIDEEAAAQRPPIPCKFLRMLARWSPSKSFRKKAYGFIQRKIDFPRGHIGAEPSYAEFIPAFMVSAWLRCCSMVKNKDIPSQHFDGTHDPIVDASTMKAMLSMAFSGPRFCAAFKEWSTSAKDKGAAVKFADCVVEAVRRFLTIPNAEICRFASNVADLNFAGSEVEIGSAKNLLTSFLSEPDNIIAVLDDQIVSVGKLCDAAFDLVNLGPSSFMRWWDGDAPRDGAYTNIDFVKLERRLEELVKQGLIDEDVAGQPCQDNAEQKTD